jgi:hypothetical protein
MRWQNCNEEIKETKEKEKVLNVTLSILLEIFGQDKSNKTKTNQPTISRMDHMFYPKISESTIIYG